MDVVLKLCSDKFHKKQQQMAFYCSHGVFPK